MRSQGVLEWSVVSKKQNSKGKALQKRNPCFSQIKIQKTLCVSTVVCFRTLFLQLQLSDRWGQAKLISRVATLVTNTW